MNTDSTDEKMHSTFIHDGPLILESLLMRIEGSICTSALLFGKGESTLKSDSVKWGNNTPAIQE